MDWFEEELPPDYTHGTALDSLTDDPSALESRLEEIDVAQKPAEAGVRRGVVKELDSRTNVVVIIHPEFDVAA